MLKLLYITGLYPPPETANGIRAYYFVRELVRSGYDVTVLETVSRADPSVGGFFGERVIRLPLRSRSTLARMYDILYKVFFVRDRVKEMLSEEKLDLVVATWPSHEAIVLGGLLSRDLRIPLVVDIQDLSDYYSEIGSRSTPIALMSLYRWIYGIIGRADKIVTVTEPFRKILEVRTGRKDIEVVYNGVDAELYGEALRKILRREVREPPVGVFVGDLNWRYHMLDRFIIALAMLKRVSSKNPTKLRIVGTGAMIRKYRELVDRLNLSEAASFEGYLERGELVSTLVTADYGIIGRPSINNPWNVASVRTTLYEYIAAGLPIFAFGPKKSYIKTLLDVNKCGYYVQYDDPLVIAENLEKFLGLLKSFDRKTIHERSYRYNWPTLAKQFVEIIRGI